MSGSVRVGLTSGKVHAGGEAGTRPAVSVAPMMALTDRHFRFLARRLSPSVLLYSEMLTAKAVIHGDRDHLLGKDVGEGDVVLQLGGDDPQELARAAAIGARYGYVEVNLNVGCPSARVASGNFGACLMAKPQLVGESLAAMREAGLPVSVKHRIGIDDADSYDDLRTFVDTVDEVSRGVASAYVVHARKAWLSGLSPKENRSVPPLRHADVHRLKAERPELVVEINGGISSVEQTAAHLRHVDGVMIGRAAYEDPTLLARLETLLAGLRPVALQDGRGTPEPSRGGITRRGVVEDMLAYCEREVSAGTPLAAVTRHLLNLFKGVPGARAWRRTLTEGAHLPGAGPELLLEALAAVSSAVADEPLAGADVRSAAERAEVLAGDDQMLDLVGAFADAH